MSSRGVVLVSHQPAFGGAERSLCTLLAELDVTRFRPVVVTSAEGPLAAACRELGAPVELVPMLWSGPAGKIRGLPSAARALAAVAARHGASLLHANTLIAGYASWLAARRVGLPLVWHLRDMQYPWLGRAVARRAAAVVAPSAVAAATLGRGSNARVVPNGVATRFFAVGDVERDVVRAELAVASRTPVALMAGRLDTWKGHTVAIETFRQVVAVFPDAQLWIAGGTEFAGRSQRLANYRDALEHRAREAGLGERVRFLGRRDDVPSLLAGADVVLQPSTDAESFGRTAAEAKAAARPVIGSDLGGLREVIRDGVDGELVPPGDAAALGRAIVRAFGDPVRRRALGMAARDDAARRFSAAAHARGIEAIYAELTGVEPAATAASTATSRSVIASGANVSSR